MAKDRKSSYIMEDQSADCSISVIFSLKEAVGALAGALKIFKVSHSSIQPAPSASQRQANFSTGKCLKQKFPPETPKKNGINLLRIESRSSSRFSDGYEFLVEMRSPAEANTTKCLDDLRAITQYMKVISRHHTRSRETIPWFPRKIQQIDEFANHILSYGADLDSDHPVSSSLFSSVRLVRALSGRLLLLDQWSRLWPGTNHLKGRTWKVTLEA